MILPLDTTVIADLDRIGVLIERDGFAAVPAHLLRSLADDSKRLGIRPIAADVLTSSSDPIVARERAFSRLAIGLIGATP